MPKGGSYVQVEDRTAKVLKEINAVMKGRVTAATGFLKKKITSNISTSATISIGPRGGIRISDRSKPGEFPKKVTGDLIKSLRSGVFVAEDGVYDGFVGTNLDYGFYLETLERFDRSFLLRTLLEEAPEIRAMLTGPIE